MRNKFLRFCIRLAFVCACLYVLACALLYIFQRRMVFIPFPGPTTPSGAGLTGFTEQRIPTPDNLPGGIRYWYSAGQSGKPLLFYFHGNGGGLHAFTFALPHLQAQGYSVVAMEYRGYPGSAGTPTEKTIVADALLLTETLRGREPYRPVVLWGYSLGSGIATQIAATITGESALILEAPFTSVADRGAELWPIFPVRSMIRDPFRSIDHIARVGTPLYIMHGERDWIVPAAHSARLFAAAQSPKERHTYPQANHFTLVDHGAYDAAFAFIARTSGMGPATNATSP